MGGELVEPAPPPSSYTEQFNAAFPFYLSIGMTYDQYWNDDCTLVIPYRKAHMLQEQRRNYHAWLQGAYIYSALLRVSPAFNAFTKTGTKIEPYIEHPFPITKEEARKLEEEKQRANLKKAVAMFGAWAAQLDLPEGGE